MNDLMKLRVLLSHWIKHNEQHADEFGRWADEAGGPAPDVPAAAERMVDVNQALVVALEQLGGVVELDQAGGHTHGH